MSYVATSNVGIVYHYEYEHTHTTIPHKMFDFMALGIPLVVTECAPLKRIVTEWRCGYAVPYGDTGKLIEALTKLGDRKHAKELGMNGKRAVLEKYNYSREIQSLQGVYDNVVMN